MRTSELRPFDVPFVQRGDDVTLVHFRVNGLAGCAPNRKRRLMVCTGIFGNVTCPRCRDLKEFKAVAA